MDSLTLYTIGHSNHAIETFLDRLQRNQIQVVVDVRSYPMSRYNPQFNRETLRESLDQHGIDYVSRWHSSLGGRGNPEQHLFDEGIQGVLELARTKRVAVMCSEGDHHKCHRHSKLTPVFEQLGATVIHILRSGEQEVNDDSPPPPPAQTSLLDFPA